jgi:hypothetical protein
MKIIPTYQYFYKQYYKNEKYIFKPSLSATKQIEKFISTVKKDNKNTVIGNNWVFNYFVFQFSYWDKCELEIKTTFSSRIGLSYIIGPKAYKRYRDRNQDFDWAIERSEIFEKYGISKVGYKKLFEGPKKEIDETPIKLLHYGTDRGFNDCLNFTTLYNHHNLICMKCKYKVDCKSILKASYPKIYTERGYK